MKYKLIEATVTNKPHQGLVVKAFYKSSECVFEKPHKIVFFNRWPPVEFEGEYVELKLNGVYAYPNGTRTSTIRGLCPKDKNGKYLIGYSPENVIHHHQNILRKVSD